MYTVTKFQGSIDFLWFLIITCTNPPVWYRNQGKQLASSEWADGWTQAQSCVSQSCWMGSGGVCQGSTAYGQHRGSLLCLTLNFLLKNIEVPTPVLLWLSSNYLIFNSKIPIFTSRHSIKKKLSLPSKHLKSKYLMLHGSCGSGPQYVWCGVVQNIKS